MGLILYNGQIHTMDDQNTICQAVYLDGKTIHSLGNNEEILKLKEGNTQVIDLENKVVLPGFNDSHMHLLGYGMALCQVDLNGSKSVEDMIEKTKAFIKDNDIKPGSWILGRGWNQDLFDKKEIPTNKDLDKISTDHGIVLRRVCGHVAIANSKVLEDLNLSEDFTETPGGSYDHGIFRENAMDLIFDQMPKPDKDLMKHYIKTGVKALHQVGITSVQSDDLCVFPKDLSQMTLEAFEELAADDDLQLNVYEQALFRDLSHFEKFVSKGYQANKTVGNFKYGPLKILGDGALGGRTAWLRKGYADAPETKGISMYSQEDLNDYVAFAQKNDISVAIHCIGDAMLDSALEAIEKAMVLYPNDKLRHGIVHCQITHTDQLHKMRDLNILAYVQPIFLDYDLHILEDRVGKDLASTSYAWQTMVDLGIKIPFGSDAPVETPDPLKGIHCAVKRQTLQGWPEDSYNSKENISLHQALRYYTADGAYSSYDEDHKGQIQSGFLADLVILDSSRLDSILDVSVHTTIFQGEIVYTK